ncbi:MAG: hypothetical protein K6F11_09675, partial [Lachnospiraceae bacterium]|nr:hypothetical protein [Lachnospiraceae bacterium]
MNQYGPDAENGSPVRIVFNFKEACGFSNIKAMKPSAPLAQFSRKESAPHASHQKPLTVPLPYFAASSSALASAASMFGRKFSS